jgi:hypothetical protein
VETQVCFISLYYLILILHIRILPLAFRKLPRSERVQLAVATSVSQSLLILPKEMWDLKTKKGQRTASYASQGYPIDVDNITSLEKVYSTCIHPSQYIPQMFTNENATIILASGTYSAEKHATNAPIIVGPVTQHSKHLLQTGVIYYSYCYYLLIVIY